LTALAFEDDARHISQSDNIKEISKLSIEMVVAKNQKKSDLFMKDTKEALESCAGVKFDSHLVAYGKRLTKAQQAQFQNMLTLKEQDWKLQQSSGKQCSGGGRCACNNERSLYFDFEQFREFKETNPEFLDWLEQPENYI